MMSKALAWFCLATLLAGGAWALARKYRDVPTPAVAARQTEQLAEGMRDALETVTARIRKRDGKTRAEVRVIHETARTRVNALPADSVTDRLNDELALWRGMEAGTKELDGD
ncbi:MAG: hypothetical protein LBD04_01910 [Synergistaceae bacterium]|jgi:hypothetical protein|nr:hypothetical protein [Synergistaceae bacterium]